MASFSEVFEDVTKQGHKIPKENYLPSGLYPIIDQGQDYIAGYSNARTGLYESVPAIIFGDHTRVIKYVDTPFFLGADGVKLLRAKALDANYKYLYYALCSVQIPNTGYNRHFKWLKEINIPLPSAPEQEHIVNTLDKINNLIALRKQQLAKLDELVKARFLEMFGYPVQGQKYPLIAIGEIGRVVTGSTPSMKKAEYYSSNDIMFIKPGDIAEEHVTAITSSGAYISENARSVARIFPEKAVLVTCIGTIGKVGISTKESSCNQQINVVIPGKEVNYLYLAHTLLYMKERLKEAANAPVVPILNKSDFSKLTLPKPPLELQEQFASFVGQIDQHKLTMQQSLDKLELLKKSLMQEYFK